MLHCYKNLYKQFQILNHISHLRIFFHFSFFIFDSCSCLRIYFDKNVLLNFRLQQKYRTEMNKNEYENTAMIKRIIFLHIYLGYNYSYNYCILFTWVTNALRTPC